MFNNKIEKIEDAYNKYILIEKYSYISSIDKIRENEFNLNIPRYADTFTGEEHVDMDAVKENIEKN
ncbi:MAG: N-6 DNA methylase [Candidatus Wallbacteria bacterium]